MTVSPVAKVSRWEAIVSASGPACLAARRSNRQTDGMTWADLESLLLRDGIAQASPEVFKCLRAVAAAAGSGARRDALAAAGAALGTDGNAGRLLRSLAADQAAPLRRLALELATHMPIPRKSILISWLRPLLRDERITTKVRLAAAAALVRSAAPSEAYQVLRDFAAGYGKVRFLEHRRILRHRFVGRKKAFDRYAARLAVRIGFGCPRCGIKLPREAMGRHLWDRHHRLLAGRRVRSPWRLIDLWAASPGGSPANAYRQLLHLVSEDDVALAALRRDAGNRAASVCPQCFAPVLLNPATFPAAADVPPLNLSHGRLSGQGFVVELADSLRGPRLRIETPSGVLFNGAEPNPPAGSSMRRLASLPLIVVALMLAAMLPPYLALPATLLSLLAAACFAMLLRAGEPDTNPDRIVDLAWRKLVPHLHADGFDPADADFLAGLAATSRRHGDASVRDRILQRTVALTHAAIVNGSARAAHLIPLQKLRVADALASGGDPVAILADSVRPCFTGELTPAAADLLLTDDLFAGWTRGQRARLRVLIAARAFTAGLGVWDLHAFGRASPLLGRVLNVEDTDGLARLRLLWDLRPTRPWHHCGPAATVFELAKYPMLGGQHLETAPDLLLFQPLPAGGEPIQLLACGRGLIVGGGLIHHWPTPIETRPLPGSKGGGYELRFGAHAVQVRGNIDDLVRKLEAWGRYFFEEFLPWIGNALSRADDGRSARLGMLSVICPECGTQFVGRRGELGRRDLAKSSRPSTPDSA